MKRLAWIVVLGSLGSLAGCATRKREEPSPLPSVSSESLAPSPSVDAAKFALEPDASSTRTEPMAIQGTVTLVIQRVDSHCMVEPGETHTAFLAAR